MVVNADNQGSIVGRERKGQTGDRTRDYPIHAGRSATELSSPSLEESSTPTSIALAKNPVFHDRSKHIDIQYHCTRDLIKEGKIQLEYILTNDMLADLTKSGVKE